MWNMNRRAKEQRTSVEGEIIMGIWAQKLPQTIGFITSLQNVWRFDDKDQ